MVRSPARAQYIITFQLERHTRSSRSTERIRSPLCPTLHMRRHLHFPICFTILLSILKHSPGSHFEFAVCHSKVFAARAVVTILVCTIKNRRQIFQVTTVLLHSLKQFEGIIKERRDIYLNQALGSNVLTMFV